MSHVNLLDELTVNDTACGANFRRFAPQERRQLLEDDLFAGRSVSTVLITIVTVGMVMMTATVLFSLFVR